MSGGLWQSGRCFSMRGCGWAQRGSDSDTYHHFGTHRAAADFAREENKAEQREEERRTAERRAETEAARRAEPSDD